MGTDGTIHGAGATPNISFGATAKKSGAGRHLIIDMTSQDQVKFSGKSAEDEQKPAVSRKTELYASGGRKLIQSLGLGLAGALCYGGAVALSSAVPPLSIALVAAGVLSGIGSNIMGLWGMVNLGRGLFAKG